MYTPPVEQREEVKYESFLQQRILEVDWNKNGRITAVEKSQNGILYMRNIPKRTPWKKILTSKATLAIVVCHFCYNWGNYVFLTRMWENLFNFINLKNRSNE